MAKTVLISVTEEDIKTGVPAKGDSCAIALAVKRAIKGNTVVGCYQIYHKPFLRRQRIYQMPNWVIELRRQFDAREHISPFSFTLEVA